MPVQGALGLVGNVSASFCKSACTGFLGVEGVVRCLRPLPLLPPAQLGKPAGRR